MLDQRYIEMRYCGWIRYVEISSDTCVILFKWKPERKERRNSSAYADLLVGHEKNLKINLKAWISKTGHSSNHMANVEFISQLTNLHYYSIWMHQILQITFAKTSHRYFNLTFPKNLDFGNWKKYLMVMACPDFFNWSAQLNSDNYCEPQAIYEPLWLYRQFFRPLCSYIT